MNQKALAKKMVAVMQAVDAVEKRGKNEKQGYGYVKATDVAREVRAALIAQGVSFGYSVEKTERWSQQTHSGGTMNFIELWGNVSFHDSESGETAVYQGIGWGMDTGDKAPYKAMTGLLKYALRMNLMIPDELDPENDKDEPAGKPNGIQRKSEKAQIGITAGGEPIFDEYGDPVVERPAAPPVTKTNGYEKQVGIPRGKRFFAIAMGAGHSKEEINNYLGGIGVEKSEEIPVSKYEDACKWAAIR